MRDAPYPRLLPLVGVLDGPDSIATPDIEEAVLSRADRLRARANRLSRRTVIDDATRRRMERGVTIP